MCLCTYFTKQSVTLWCAFIVRITSGGVKAHSINMHVHIQHVHVLHWTNVISAKTISVPTYIYMKSTGMLWGQRYVWECKLVHRTPNTSFESSKFTCIDCSSPTLGLRMNVTRCFELTAFLGKRSLWSVLYKQPVNLITSPHPWGPLGLGRKPKDSCLCGLVSCMYVFMYAVHVYTVHVYTSVHTHTGTQI